MNGDRTNLGASDARHAIEAFCTPEQSLVMAMLASPAAGNLWGDPGEIAAAVSWDRFLVATDPMVKPYLHWVCQTGAFSAVVPDFVQLELSAARRAAGLRNLRWSAELRQILEKFRNESIPLIVVKGAVLQRSVYPDPSTRPMSDIDLCVRDADMARVYRALTDLGFAGRVPREGQTPIVGDSVHEEGTFLKKIGDTALLLEVHTQLEMYSGYQVPPWGKCIEIRGGDGIEVPALDPHTALRHICFHLARHGFEHGLMWLLDVRLFVEKNRALMRWPEFVAECDPPSRPLLACTLALASEWLGADIPQRALEAISAEKKLRSAPLIWSQLWEGDRITHPLPVVTLLLSGDLRRILDHLRDRVRSWTAPLPGSDLSRGALVYRRLRTVVLIHYFNIRSGGFRLSSLRATRHSDRRFQQLRALLWPPA